MTAMIAGNNEKSDHIIERTESVIDAGSTIVLPISSVVILAPAMPRNNATSEPEMAVMSALGEKKNISIQQLVAKVDFKNPMGVIKGLLDRRVLSIHENIQSAFKPKYEVFVRLHSRLKTDDDVNKLFEELSRATAQQKYLMAFLAP